MSERIQSFEDVTEGDGFGISIDLSSLRNFRDGAIEIVRALRPFNGWGMVPHSEIDSSVALTPRVGEPPNAEIRRLNKRGISRRAFLGLNRLHRYP